MTFGKVAAFEKGQILSNVALSVNVLSYLVFRSANPDNMSTHPRDNFVHILYLFLS